MTKPLSTDKSLRHITGLVADFAFLDKCTANLREKGLRKNKQKYNERLALELARQMALEDNEHFEDFCEAQYTGQGRVLFNALKRVRLP